MKTNCLHSLHKNLKNISGGMHVGEAPRVEVSLGELVKRETCPNCPVCRMQTKWISSDNNLYEFEF